MLVAGWTTGNLSGTGTATGTDDGFVRRYSPEGGVRWTSQFGVAGVLTRATSVAVSPAGDVYVAGRTLGALGGQTLLGTQDGFLRAYTYDGGYRWTRLDGSATGISLTGATAVTVNSAGNVDVAGSTDGALAGCTVANPCTLLGATDAYVRQYTRGASVLWTRQIGTAAPDPDSITQGMALAATRGTALFMGGVTTGEFPTFTNDDRQDGLIAKIA